jgi:hypothetical protein
MQFRDKEQKIYLYFKNDWLSSNRTKVYKILKKRIISWEQYINRKKLGIIVERIGPTDTEYYNIIDEKKWAIARIKYGI